MEEDGLERENTTNDYAARENLWDQAWPFTDESDEIHPSTEPDNIDEELPFPEVAGTRESMESVRDAEPYVPPTDPPVLPGGAEGIHMATGFGTSPEEAAEPSEPLRSDADIQDAATLLLRQDSLTSKYPLSVDVDQGVVRLQGEVPSIQDAEYATSIVGELDGVVDVVDETTVSPASAE